ncbi:MAG TPA: hypothetical protein ENI77_11725 [Nitrospirae bacterium]|nr:hypothetical protein [Nitrospirota bacterium]
MWRAYAKGAQMRARLTGDGAFKTAIIDDLVAPHVGKHETVDEFMNAYEAHLSELQKKLVKENAYRVPLLQNLETVSRDGWNSALRSAVSAMHDNNAWPDNKTGKKLSIGLVRMANIKPAIETATYLAGEFPQARVACYHSNHLAIQRFCIEKRLDELLTRKNGYEHILDDKEIRDMLDDPEYSELMLIVVATPVEEIGRDHDFDWAVIEPSSAQSIVQTAGRVNRHRLNENIGKPNISIMRYNLREVGDENLVFRWPGLEVKSENKYESHDLGELLDWDNIDIIDARIRFGAHKFAKLDDESIERSTENIFASMTSSDTAEKLWMALETYTKSRLRDNEGKKRIELTLKEPYDKENSFMCREENSNEDPAQRNIKSAIANVPNAWLAKSDSQLVELARAVFDGDEYEVDRSMSVSVIANSASDISRHMSFGFCRDSNS